MTNQVEQLRKHTTVVCDTGDIESIEQYRPTDATTNPSLIFAAAQQEEYQHLIKDAVEYGRAHGTNDAEKRAMVLDKLFVNFGTEILKVVPGRVSTEVDARLSFDVEKSIEKAHRFIRLYEEQGIGKERVLIKLAATWEGIQAAERLEKEGIHCNLTLIFGMAQAVSCADAKVTLISPFVGRILDWHKKAEGVDSYPAPEDPGVRSVTAIYNYYKKYDYNTQVMGASFRNKGEILELAGVDLLTIAPALLEEMQNCEDAVEPKLIVAAAKKAQMPRLQLNESDFRFMMNEDQMATEKLAEGIRSFAKAAVQLEEYVFSKYPL